MGKSIYEVLPNLPIAFKKILKQSLQGVTNEHSGRKFINPDGVTICYSWKLKSWKDTQGSIGGIVLVLDKCYKQLGYDELLIDAQEVSRTGGWQVNLIDFGVLWTKMVNVIHEEPLDYVPLSLDACFEHFIAGEHREKMYALVSEAVEHGTPWDAEIQMKTGKGNIIWIRSKGQAEFINGKCTRLYGICQDINDKKQAELKYKEEVELLRGATKSSKVGIWEYTFHSKKAIWDDVCYAIHHLDKTVCKDTRTSWKSRVHPEDLKKVYSKLEGFTRGEGSGVLEYRIIVDDNSIRHIRCIINYISDTDFNFVKTIGIMMDITKEKQAEKKLRDFAEITADQNSSLMNFAHMVSHDLRSHTTNLSLATSYFFEEKNPEEKARLKNMLEGATTNLLKTLDKLNEVVQSNAEIKEKLVPVNLLETIINVQQNLAMLFEEQHVNCNIKVLKEHNILAIPAYLESVFLNLCTNSIKYRYKERPPKIEIRSSKIGDRIHVVFKDNGRGINLLKHGNYIFGMHKTFHRNKDANGVGLYITKNQIEAMGGTISVTSEVHVGTTFILELTATKANYLCG
jgi:signal transduction histidine kinase